MFCWPVERKEEKDGRAKQRGLSLMSNVLPLHEVARMKRFLPGPQAGECLLESSLPADGALKSVRRCVRSYVSMRNYCL